MTTCVIAWIDEQGESTRDDHDAVGLAFTRLHGLTGVSESMRWPICQVHPEQMLAFPPTWGWYVEPLALDASVE